MCDNLTQMTAALFIRKPPNTQNPALLGFGLMAYLTLSSCRGDTDFDECCVSAAGAFAAGPDSPPAGRGGQVRAKTPACDLAHPPCAIATSQ